MIVRPLSRHHIVGRDQGGDDVEENIAILCGHGTAGCHGLVQGGDVEACTELRQAMTQEQIEYGVERLGRDRFDRYYPPFPHGKES